MKILVRIVWVALGLVAMYVTVLLAMMNALYFLLQMFQEKEEKKEDHVQQVLAKIQSMQG